MTVNFEIKGMLARLLSTEDLIVENKKVETACFNVHTRVLTLPIWERASNAVYDLLLSHESAHAIFTDNIDWTQDHKIPQQFVNVVEDVRIEKLMKRRYAGLAKIFYAGYKELADQDFFQIGDADLETFNLADRINLYFKIGNYVDVPIQIGEETEIADLIANTETFDDVLNAAKVLYEYCKQKQQEKTEEIPNSQETTESGASDATNREESGEDESENEEPGETDSYGGTAQQNQSTQSQGSEKSESEPEVQTMNSLEKSLKDLVNNYGTENVYLELPQIDLTKIIVPNSEIHSQCKETWSSYLQTNNYQYSDIFGEVDRQFVDFKRSAQKEVNYLVKEFECRKAADSYSRATVSRTGVLDCSRIHSYKYNEDLFKKITTLADGKNHGLIFVLDWSGSMTNVMMDTVKQLFNLIWFCKKVSIPFEVYAFTHDYPLVSYDSEGKANIRQLSYQKKDNLIRVEELFSMMNLFTSKVNNRVLEEQMRNVFRLAYGFQQTHAYCSKYPIPMGLSLSGTPLNEALISLHQILPQFQKQNKLQKVQCVVLTDGESNAPKYHREIARKWEETPYMGTCSIGPNSFLRDRKTGNTYSLGTNWWQFTDVILHNLRDTFTNTNFIGIRVIESRDTGSFVRRYCGYHGSDYDNAMNSWKKEKSFTLKTSGYHSYFGLSSTALSQDTEFSVSEDASKSQIKTAFAKSLKSKKMNKRILGEFISLVA